MDTAASFPGLVIEELKNARVGDSREVALELAIARAVRRAPQANADWIARGCEPSIASVVAKSGLLDRFAPSPKQRRRAAAASKPKAAPDLPPPVYEEVVQYELSKPQYAGLEAQAALAKAANAVQKQYPQLHRAWCQRGYPRLSHSKRTKDANYEACVARIAREQFASLPEHERLPRAAAAAAREAPDLHRNWLERRCPPLAA